MSPLLEGPWRTSPWWCWMNDLPEATLLPRTSHPWDPSQLHPPSLLVFNSNQKMSKRLHYPLPPPFWVPHNDTIHITSLQVDLIGLPNHQRIEFHCIPRAIKYVGTSSSLQPRKITKRILLLRLIIHQAQNHYHWQWPSIITLQPPPSLLASTSNYIIYTQCCLCITLFKFRWMSHSKSHTY